MAASDLRFERREFHRKMLKAAASLSIIGPSAALFVAAVAFALLLILAIADWAVMGLYVALMAAIGLWSYRKVDRAEDFFAAGGKMPWWLSGISHHMSGYSGAVF